MSGPVSAASISVEVHLSTDPAPSLQSLAVDLPTQEPADTRARYSDAAHRADDLRFRLRPNRGDPLHDLQLQRDVETINARTARALGPPPFRGPSAHPRYTSRLRHDSATLSAQTPSTPGDSTMQWTSVAAIAALATSGTLAACGANGTQPQPIEAPTIEAAAPSTSTPEVQAVSPAADTAEVGPVPPLDAQPTEPVRGPAIPAAQLRRQILALLGSLRTLEDLEKQHVESTLQIRLSPQAGMRDGHHYFGRTSEGWNYRVAVERLGRMEEPPTIKLYLNNGVEPWTDQQPTYCTLDFESVAKDLVAAGYTRTDRMIRLKGNEWWGFGKDRKESRTGLGASVYVYRVPDDESGRYCIGQIRISGDHLDV
jgi:hypothetical protein